MVDRLDAGVGKLLDKLDELKLSDHTIVVFFSDNGGLSVKEGPNTPATSNAPLRAGKGYLYEGGIREPLIVRWPGVTKAGSTCDTPVISNDFFPTFVHACNGKADPSPDGVSLLPLLKGEKPQGPPRALFWHYPHYSNQGGKPGAAVRVGDWKLIEFYEDDRAELYNLKDDVGERTDLAAKEPQRAADLRRRLAEWRNAVDAQMMTPNPDYRAGATTKPKGG